MVARMEGVVLRTLPGPKWRIWTRLRTLSTLPEAAKSSHLGGIPRWLVFTTVGHMSKFYNTVLNKIQVHNKDTLLALVKSRPLGTPLVTVSNHMSTLDDPMMWGIPGFPLSDPKLCRWTLAAEDICFTNPAFSYFFRLGKCIPITRGKGIYQPNMDEALDRINEGDWIHTFPEGKVCQEQAPLRRLKWGTASLIARAAVSPIILPIGHSGYEKVSDSFSENVVHPSHIICKTYQEVVPENYWNGRRPLIPLWNKRISLVVGEPIQFDVPGLKKMAYDWSRGSTGLGTSVNRSDDKPLDADGEKPTQFGPRGYNPHPLPFGVRKCSSLLQVVQNSDKSRTGWTKVPEPLLDEVAWRWMYTHITEHLWVALHDVTRRARTLRILSCKNQAQ